MMEQLPYGSTIFEELQRQIEGAVLAQVSLLYLGYALMVTELYDFLSRVCGFGMCFSVL